MSAVSFLYPAAGAFLLCVILCRVFIPILKRIKCGQYVREEGPRTHLKKNGTPTMGGIVILLSILSVSLCYVNRYPEILPVLFVTLGYGLIGFLDDCIKVFTKRAQGLSVLQKLVLQTMMAVLFFLCCHGIPAVTFRLLLPFSHGKYLELGSLSLPFLLLTLLGTVNGVNLTDGVDGLATGVTFIVTVFLSVYAIGTAQPLAPVICAAAGALFGFLIFNMYPARVFMGDTGSLALGGFVAGAAFLLQIPLFIVMIGMVYLAEVVSVLLQVAVYRFCHRKRLFRMAPLHHHFELGGWSETKIVAVFTGVTAVCCLVALLGIE